MTSPEKTITYRHPEIGQRYISWGGMATYLTMLTAFAALSTDLYLPALPTMAKLFGVSEGLTNMTLISFGISFSVMTLIWGPVSDRYGRRPVLIIGTLFYMAAGIMCSVALNIYIMILARILQGAGAAAASAMGIAIVKDSFTGRSREKVLAIVNSMVIVCPTVAPFFGSVLLNVTSWKGIFMLQALFGLIVFILSLIYTETIPERAVGSPIRMMGRLIVVLKNPPFTILLITFSISGASALAYIGSSAYIYQDYYGLGSTAYSIFFGVNAAFMMSGPFLYIQLSKIFKSKNIISVCLAFNVLSGLLMLLFSSVGPYMFSASLIIMFVASSCTKPPAVNMMLNMQKTDTGSASSLINSLGLGLGTGGIALTSLPFLDPPHLLGTILIVIALISLTLWLLKGRKCAEKAQT